MATQQPDEIETPAMSIFQDSLQMHFFLSSGHSCRSQMAEFRLVRDEIRDHMLELDKLPSEHVRVVSCLLPPDEWSCYL